MKILVLGGTAFLGRAFVDSAIERGHEVTLFNRGQRNPGLFPQLEQINGDRTVDLSPLNGRVWDAVFDSCGYVPRVVKMSAEALRDATKLYLFISSISVLKDFSIPGQSEDAEVAVLDDPLTEEITGKTYGGLKALCEQTLQQIMSNRSLVVRPGLIVGPTDYTDRFTYWPVRMQRGGTVLVPDQKTQPVQVIDVRDLGRWCVELLEKRVTGVLNATGPQDPFTLEQVLTACAAGTDATLEWVSREFLAEYHVEPWSQLPLALDYDGSSNGMFQVDVSRAYQAGLHLRPLEETIRDTREWAMSRPADHVWSTGLTPDRETELLIAWRASRPT